MLTRRADPHCRSKPFNSRTIPMRAGRRCPSVANRTAPLRDGSRWYFTGPSLRPRPHRGSVYLLHEWSEVIPSLSEQTAVAFHYDDPGAEAPQAILLAVSPTNAATWDFDTVAAILQETLDLAKIRGVDSQLLGQLGQVLPAVYVAENAANDTIGVNFSQMRMQEAQIVGP